MTISDRQKKTIDGLGQRWLFSTSFSETIMEARTPRCHYDPVTGGAHCSADNTTSEPPDKFPTYDATQLLLTLNRRQFSY